MMLVLVLVLLPAGGLAALDDGSWSPVLSMAFRAFLRFLLDPPRPCIASAFVLVSACSNMLRWWVPAAVGASVTTDLGDR